MKTALITGVTGQDGKYLSHLLLEKGYTVFGTTSRSISLASNALSEEIQQGLNLMHLDLADSEAISQIVNEIQPDELYNLAAFARGSTMWDLPAELSDINGLAVARILEAIRQNCKSIKFCQASSSEMFGHAQASPQSEVSGFSPRSPYGAAKLYAHNMVNIYRDHHGLFACSAILFNHESPNRPTDFVTRKVTQEAARIKLGLADTLPLGNLEARRDWGFAGDYTRALWMMLQHNAGADYVVASGETQSVATLCDIAFSHLGLDYRQYVTTEPAFFRETEKIQLMGDASLLKETLGWQPSLSFTELVQSMVDHDLALLKQ
ncbi:MAG: GDP-mannose 4,6-dehydratase [Halioglobus sp.]